MAMVQMCKVGKSEIDMRILKRNKKNLKYATYLGEIAKTETDEHGNVIEVGEPQPTYSEPITFEGNIALSGGNAEAVEFGLDLADYSAKIILEKDTVPITEGSLIWDKSEPQVDDEGHGLKISADYVVVKVSPTINVDKFVLQKVVN